MEITGIKKLKISDNSEKTIAPRVLVQDSVTGEVGWVAKSLFKISNEQVLFNSDHYTMLNQTAKQKIFSQGELNVVAGKIYVFIMEVSLYQFSTYGRSVGFSMLGTANVSNLNLNMTTVLNANTPSIYINLSTFIDAYFTNGQMGWSGTAHIKGSFTASVNGTLIPAFYFDALPGANFQATSGSYFKLTQIN